MIEQLELAQGPRGSSHHAEKDRHRIKLRCAELPIVADCSEFGESKFIRLFSRTLPDLKDGQLKFLRNLCYVAHRSEEFFHSIPTNQWVRTIITYDTATEKLSSPKSIVEECSRLISIRSNILPCDPFWTKLQAIRDGPDGTCQRSVHYPCSVLEEEGNILMQKLSSEGKEKGECKIGQHGSERYPSRLLWESEANDEVQKEVKTLKELATGSDGIVWLVSWRGGMFVRKDSREQIDSNPRDTSDIEVIVVEKLSHPHIVYSFGVSYSVTNRSLFMEYMQYDLFHFIVQRVRTTDVDKPPFSHQDSVDILLQIAKAMAHMHEKNVVHGDLKSQNILINEVLISEPGVTHYLVKVADFGSAQFVNSDSESKGFRLEAASTKYAAPEALKMRVDKNVVTFFPKALDVYGFGIVAFEVLTGEKLYRNMSPSEVKKGVIEGLRPPLRAKCGNDNFLHDRELMSLIEDCWLGEPSERPSFLKIVKVLDSVKVQILETPSSLSDHTPSQAHSVGAPQVAAPGSNGRYPPPPFQENNTSDALHGQVLRPSRLPKKFPRKFLRPFWCLSGGKVQS